MLCRGASCGASARCRLRRRFSLYAVDIASLTPRFLCFLDVYTGPGLTPAGVHRIDPTPCHPMSLSQATDITGGASLRSPSSYTTTTAGFSAETLSTPKTTMDPVLPLTIVKRKKVGMQAPHHHKVKAPVSAQQAPLEVVQEESEPPSSASSTYSFDLSRSSSSPRSSYDSKRSVSTADTSPAPSLKRVSLDDSHNDTQEATSTTTKEQKPTKMPCGTSFLHMGPPTPISTSPIPPASPPKPSKGLPSPFIVEQPS